MSAMDISARVEIEVMGYNKCIQFNRKLCSSLASMMMMTIDEV